MKKRETGEKVRVVAFLDAEVAAKLAEFAGKLGLSESMFLGNVLTTAFEESEWLLKVMTNRYARRLAAALGVGAKASAGDGADPAGDKGKKGLRPV